MSKHLFQNKKITPEISKNKVESVALSSVVLLSKNSNFFEAAVVTCEHHYAINENNATNINCSLLQK